MSWMRKPSEATVLLIDIGKNVNQQNHDGQSFLHKSKQCASRIIQRKIFSDSKDEFSVILIGSEKSDNDFEYPNIDVKYKWLNLPNWNMLKFIENLVSTSINNADWLDGLIVAINLLKNESESKKFTEQKIVMTSNFRTPIKSMDQIEDVIEALRDLKISLIVIGPQTEEDGDSEHSCGISVSKNKGMAIINRIVDEVDGVMCGFNESMSQLDHFQKFVGRAQAWYCDLKIGKNIFIPISGFKKFAAKSFLNWKKRSVDKGSVTQETVFFQGEKQVEKTDVINSYLFGQTVVPISGDDKTSMKLTTEKGLKVVGFTKSQNVPQHILLGDSVHYIAPRPDVMGAKKALTALIKALLELQMVGIVRKVYCKNVAPCLGALIPTCEQESFFFYYVQLPYAEDERLVRLPSLNNVESRQEKLNAIDHLIDGMDLSNMYREDDEQIYNKLINPSVEHTYSMIVFKALNPDSKLPMEQTDMVMNLMKPKLKIIQNVSKPLENIKTLFHLEEYDQKNYRKGAADVFNQRNSADSITGEDFKPENLADSMASFVKTTVTEIGTINPEGNFLQMLNIGEPFNKVSEQMQVAIKKLLLTSSSSISIKKSVSALSLLRNHSIMNTPFLYNQFIASLKDDAVERDHSEFWNLISQDKLGLITSEENQESGVSSEEAAIFYELKKNDSLSDINCEMEAEDLLDMI